MSDEFKDMVEKFQCPGCVLGSSTSCGRYKPEGTYGQCMNHCIGTRVLGGHPFALGLPKGFRIPGWNSSDGPQPFEHRQTLFLRFFKKGTHNLPWDSKNVAVWAMVEEGYLFVRTYQPRIDLTSIDIIEGGTLDMCPGALDVSKFLEEID